MINILAKGDCCGCGACAQKCPKHCIIMNADSEGFLYPKVNEQLCVDCGLCDRVCSTRSNSEPVQPTRVLAARNYDEEIRKKSSSGGVFSLLAEKCIAEGGVVFGARFTKDWQVEIGYTESLEGIEAFRGSKYVQASVGNAYSVAKAFLKRGRKVLFSGTPCQISGLNCFLQGNYDNLLTVDVVCHGVPSPKVWQYYLDEIARNAALAINSCSFRNKDNGWKHFNFRMELDNDGKTAIISSFHQENHYMRAFLRNMSLRPSCHTCKAKKGQSHSDITIADFWGIQNVLPEMDDDMGTGLVLVNTAKGKCLIDSIKMRSVPVTIQDALKENPSWKESVQPHPKREHFFKKIDQCKSLCKLIDLELMPSHITYKQKVRNALSKIKQMMVTSGRGNFNSSTVNIKFVSFRNKECGWSKYKMVIVLFGNCHV